MIIRIFFGIPLIKELEEARTHDLVHATFQGKRYLGIYSDSGTHLEVDAINAHYLHFKNLLEKIIYENNLASLKEDIVMFPEILIGA